MKYNHDIFFLKRIITSSLWTVGVCEFCYLLTIWLIFVDLFIFLCLFLFLFFCCVLSIKHFLPLLNIVQLVLTMPVSTSIRWWNCGPSENSGVIVGIQSLGSSAASFVPSKIQKMLITLTITTLKDHTAHVAGLILIHKQMNSLK